MSKDRIVNALTEEWRGIGRIDVTDDRGAMAREQHPAGMERPGHSRPHHRNRVDARRRDRPGTEA